MKRWYYAKDGEQKGPLNEEDLIELLKNSCIASDSPIWSEGMQEWVSANEVGLIGALPAEGLHGRLNNPPDDVNDSSKEEETELAHKGEERAAESKKNMWLLFLGCILHILFSADGISSPHNWAEYPASSLSHMVGYAIPGIVLSILFLAPIFHFKIPKPRPCFFTLRHIWYAVLIGFFVRLAMGEGLSRIAGVLFMLLLFIVLSKEDSRRRQLALDVDGSKKSEGTATAAAMLARAHSLFNRGETEEAQKEYQQILDFYPQTGAAIVARDCLQEWASNKSGAADVDAPSPEEEDHDFISSEEVEESDQFLERQVEGHKDDRADQARDLSTVKLPADTPVADKMRQRRSENTVTKKQLSQDKAYGISGEPDPKPSVKYAPTHETTDATSATIKQRLLQLDSLREDGLITDEEHRNKRQSILDQL